MPVHVIDFSKVSPTPLNPFGDVLRRYLVSELNRFRSDPKVSSIVLYGGPKHFSAGADIKEFKHALTGKMKFSDTLPTIIDMMDAYPKPIVAAIHGSCLGGGYEVALACQYRVASSGSMLGLPEVNVGVIPGAGGTQRLPRLIGIQQAAQLICAGQMVNGKKAMKLGMIDAVVQDPRQVVEEAKKWATWAEVMPKRRVRDMKFKEHPAVAHGTFHVIGLNIPEKGGSGARACLEAIRAGYYSWEQGIAKEREMFQQQLKSMDGQSIRHAFLAQRAVQALVGKPDMSHKLLSNPGGCEAAIIGAGTMGSGIALTLLRTGYIVHLVDVNPKALEKGLKFLESTIANYVKRGRMKKEQATSIKSRLRHTTNLHDLANVELVVEAVVERMAIKHKVFQTLDKVVRSPTALFLSNTSTLDVDKLAEGGVSQRRRSYFAGWHFFAPAHVMRLVEIVVGKDTSKETIVLMQVLTKRIKKIGVVVGNCDGFCGNRLIQPYGAESMMLLTEGRNTVQNVDQALRDFGMAIGSLQMGDLSGNDVGWNIRKERGWARDETGAIPPTRPERYSELADDMCSKLGRFGQKVGKGWYDYDPAIGKGRTPMHSPEVTAFLDNYKHKTGPLAGNFVTAPDDVVARTLFPLVNLGFECLREGIVRSPYDIDVVYLTGYGFPAWRGGPMFWADKDLTLPKLLDGLRKLSRQFPTVHYYKPSPLLVECVQSRMSIYDFMAQKGIKNGQLSRL